MKNTQNEENSHVIREKSGGLEIDSDGLESLSADAARSEVRYPEAVPDDAELVVRHGKLGKR